MDDYYRRLRRTEILRPKSYTDLGKSLHKRFSDWLDNYHKKAMESEEGKKWLKEKKKKDAFRQSLLNQQKKWREAKNKRENKK